MLVFYLIKFNRTGKTTTAVEIVLEWLRQSSAPILACAESNIAVDLLHNEF
jgi:superfamily I DNA and/or RNA helicase